MKYSIITPVYNREDCIARCIDSVIRNLHEAIFEIEHIIIDDGSKDNTAKIIRDYADKNDHIKFISFSDNRGTNAARNEAIKASTGDYCIILDSDDYFVDDAIKIIDAIVSKGEYKEYMFAVDDMVPRYSKNPLIGTNKQVVLKYEELLSGKVRADFVHVIDRNIMIGHPFDEKLRIYEYLFFFQFYKESQYILFTNTIISIRERSRKDSAIRETIRLNKNVIERSYLASKTDIDLYADEYVKYGLISKLQHLFAKKIENGILLSNYDDIIHDIDSPYFVGKKSLILKSIYYLKLGWLYRILLYSYLYVKYSVLKATTK